MPTAVIVIRMCSLFVVFYGLGIDLVVRRVASSLRSIFTVHDKTEVVCVCVCVCVSLFRFFFRFSLLKILNTHRVAGGFIRVQ